MLLRISEEALTKPSNGDGSVDFGKEVALAEKLG
jgi:hypothetical protein